MRKATRVLALVLALALIVCAAMTGCSKKGTDGTSSTGSAAGKIDLSTAKEMTLEYWCLGPGQQKLDAEVEAAANELLAKDMPNTKVHYTWLTGSEIVDKTTKALAANENIDMLWMGYTFPAATKDAWCRDETFEDLSALYETYLPDYYKFIGDPERKALQTDGKDYYVIGWQALAYGRHGAWVATKLLEELGYDPDQWVTDVEKLAYATYKPGERTVENDNKLLDYFRDYCQKMDDSGIYKDDPIGSIDCNAPSLILGTFRDGYGYIDVGTYFRVKIGDDVNKDGYKLETVCEMDLTKNKFEKTAEWYDKGWIRQDIASSTSGVTSKFVQYKDWQYDKLNSHNYLDPKASFESRENGKRQGFTITAAHLKPNYTLDPGKATMTCIPFTVKEDGGLERAMMFQNYLFTDACTDYYRTVIYGREGKEWVWNNDGTNTATWKMGNGSQGASDWEYGKAAWYFGNCMYALATSNGGFKPSYYIDLKANEDSMWCNPFVSFAFDASDANINMIMSNLAAINKEYTTTLGNGNLGGAGWEAYYNEYVAKMRANGLDTLEAEVLKQVQAYAKANNITSGWDAGY